MGLEDATRVDPNCRWNTGDRIVFHGMERGGPHVERQRGHGVGPPIRDNHAVSQPVGGGV